MKFSGKGRKKVRSLIEKSEKGKNTYLYQKRKKTLVPN